MAGDDADEGLLRQLIAGQATTDERFKELFRRLDKAERASGEARDKVAELLIIIREQDALARIAENRAETKKLVEDLRADVVHANTSVRASLDGIGVRLGALEQIRDGGKLLFRTGRWAVEAAKLVLAAGGGAFLAKLIGH